MWVVRPLDADVLRDVLPTQFHRGLLRRAPGGLAQAPARLSLADWSVRSRCRGRVLSGHPFFLTCRGCPSDGHDNHADACACKNYHDTMVSNGAKSTLLLMPRADDRCFCIGSPGEPAAASSPFVDKCTAEWGARCGPTGEMVPFHYCASCPWLFKRPAIVLRW